MGPGVLLKVMAGDKFNANVLGWYDVGTSTTVPPTPTIPVLGQIITSVTNSFPVGASHTGLDVYNAGNMNTPLGDFLSYQSGTPYNNTRPKAFLNWIVLDEEQFKLVDNNYGAVQIPDINPANGKEILQANGGSNIEVKKNGYLYVWVSNESNGPVYFDDLHVEHIRGPILRKHITIPARFRSGGRLD